jgi:hypothetical protein
MYTVHMVLLWYGTQSIRSITPSKSRAQQNSMVWWLQPLFGWWGVALS